MRGNLFRLGTQVLSAAPSSSSSLSWLGQQQRSLFICNSPARNHVTALFSSAKRAPLSTQATDGGVVKKQTIEELANSIDTTLTAEEQAYVATLRKQIRGGPNSLRSLYRDVPRPDEVTGVGNFLPQIAENAEALIDFALSKIPRRAGPRRSREKQRRKLKLLAKKKQDDRRKEEYTAANLKHHQKLKKQRALCVQYKEEGKRLALLKANTSIASDAK